MKNNQKQIPTWRACKLYLEVKSCHKLIGFTHFGLQLQLFSVRNIPKIRKLMVAWLLKSPSGSHYLFLCIVETHYSEDFHKGATRQSSSKTEDNTESLVWYPCGTSALCLPLAQQLSTFLLRKFLRKWQLQIITTRDGISGWLVTSCPKARPEKLVFFAPWHKCWRLITSSNAEVYSSRLEFACYSECANANSTVLLVIFTSS